MTADNPLAVMERQASDIARLRKRVESLSGALLRIKEHRPLDPALVSFCESALSGLATFTNEGEFEKGGEI